MGVVAKSYMRKGFLIYEEMRNGSSCYRDFLIYEENLVFFFYQCAPDPFQFLLCMSEHDDSFLLLTGRRKQEQRKMPENYDDDD